jgi:hypothetical protein
MAGLLRGADCAMLRELRKRARLVHRVWSDRGHAYPTRPRHDVQWDALRRLEHREAPDESQPPVRDRCSSVA